MFSIVAEALPVAVLVGAEAFFIGYGLVWGVLWDKVPREAWLWPALGLGSFLAVVVFVAAIRCAISAARAQLAFDNDMRRDETLSSEMIAPQP